MIPATAPIQRPRDARLLSVDAFGLTRHVSRSRLIDLLKPSDVVIGNEVSLAMGDGEFDHLPRRIAACE